MTDCSPDKVCHLLSSVSIPGWLSHLSGWPPICPLPRSPESVYVKFFFIFLLFNKQIFLSSYSISSYKKTFSLRSAISCIVIDREHCLYKIKLYSDGKGGKKGGEKEDLQSIFVPLGKCWSLCSICFTVGHHWTNLLRSWPTGQRWGNYKLNKIVIRRGSQLLNINKFHL